MSNNRLKHILNCHPIIKTDIIKGEDTLLIDSNGNSFIDFEAGIWCTALGHSNPRINKVMVDQLNNLIHLNHKFVHQHAEKLAVTLLEQVNMKDGKAVFLSSGSEAVQLGIRLSQLVSKPGKVLTFSSSYLSAYAIPRDKNLWVEIDYLNCNYCIHVKCNDKCNVLKDVNFDDISTFVLESATCGRVIFPPHKLIDYLTTEVKKHGGLIVANEVTTGFGRTGMWFGYNHYHVEPNIIALGKALGNGYPISGVVMDQNVSNKVEHKKFIYVQSHQNDPLGCATANEVIQIMKEESMINRSKNIGEFFIQQLKALQKDNPIIKEVRGRGLMIAVELNLANVSEIIEEEMLQRGFIIGTTAALNLLRFFPPYTITRTEILNMCKALNQILKNIEY